MGSAAIACALVYVLVYYVDVMLLSWQCLERPIVVAPLVGLILGDPLTGITMGASLEAIFMGISAVGGSVPSDCLSGTIIAVAYAIIVGGDGAVETGLALALTIGTVMSQISMMLEALWGAIAPFWEKLAQECKPKKFFWVNAVVALLTLLPAAVVIYLGVAFGVDGLQAGLAACPAWVMRGLAAAGSMMTAVGFGILISMIWSADIAVFFFVGFVLVKSLEMSSLAVAVIGAAVALFYFFIEKDIIQSRQSGTMTKLEEPVMKPANTEEDFF